MNHIHSSTYQKNPTSSGSR